MSKAVTIISGGMDSVTLTYYLKKKEFEQILLSFDYGQRHKKELLFAKRIAKTLGYEHSVISLKDVTKFLTTSALTGEQEVPEGHYNEDSMRSTVVPNRNVMMLSIAYSIANSLHAGYVATGIHAGDRYNYPDCRSEFAFAFQRMENEALQGFDPPELLTPFIGLSKADIATLGKDLKVPYHKTWSCYKGGKLHCGKCGTCVERIEALNAAKVKDRTQYEDPDYWKQAVENYKLTRLVNA